MNKKLYFIFFGIFLILISGCSENIQSSKIKNFNTDLILKNYSNFNILINEYIPEYDSDNIGEIYLYKKNQKNHLLIQIIKTPKMMIKDFLPLEKYGYFTGVIEEKNISKNNFSGYYFKTKSNYEISEYYFFNGNNKFYKFKLNYIDNISNNELNEFKKIIEEAEIK